MNTEIPTMGMSPEQLLEAWLGDALEARHYAEVLLAEEKTKLEPLENFITLCQIAERLRDPELLEILPSFSPERYDKPKRTEFDNCPF